MMKISNLLLLVLMSCSSYCADLSGTWVMTKWEDKDTGLQGVKYLELNIDSDGKLKSYVLMGDKWNYIQLFGSGTYKVNNDKIEWTHGQGTGLSKYTLENNVLTLNPDILLRADGGKIPGKGTYYKRAPSQQVDAPEPATMVGPALHGSSGPAR